MKNLVSLQRAVRFYPGTGQSQSWLDRIMQWNNTLFFLAAVLRGSPLWVFSCLFWIFTLICLIARDIKSVRRINAATVFYIILAGFLFIFLLFRLVSAHLSAIPPTGPPVSSF